MLDLSDRQVSQTKGWGCHASVEVCALRVLVFGIIFASMSLETLKLSPEVVTLTGSYAVCGPPGQGGVVSAEDPPVPQPDSRLRSPWRRQRMVSRASLLSSGPVLLPPHRPPAAVAALRLTGSSPFRLPAHFSSSSISHQLLF